LEYESAEFMVIQDHYEVGSPDLKWQSVSDFLARKEMDNHNEGSLDRQKLWLNHSSGYTTSLFGIPRITEVSDYVNPRLLEYFHRTDCQIAGIVAMDFATAELSRSIFMKNPSKHS